MSTELDIEVRFDSYRGRMSSRARARVRPAEGELERWARQIVAADLALVVDRYDDGMANAQVDAVIRTTGGVIPLEVIGDHDSAHLARWNRLESITFRLESTSLTHGWIVWLRTSAKIARLERQLPEFLDDFEWPNDPLEQDEVPPALARIGVVGLKPTDEIGVIRLYPEGWQSWDDPIDFVPWISRVLAAAPDVAAKLGAFESAGGHAFIWATSGSAWAANTMLRQDDDDDPALPQQPPVLPPGVTEVWIASTLTRRGCLHWSSEGGWRRTGWIAVEEPEHSGV